MENEEQNNNEEQNLSPDATTSEPVVESMEDMEPRESKTKKHGPVVVVAIAVACLLVVIWAVFSNLTTDNTPAPVIETPVEVVEEEPKEDPTIVEGRDPEVLGLRIDTILGRMFVLPDTGQTLYVTAEDCTGDCLAAWTPYEATEAIADGSILGTVERADGTLQYTWNGKALYTFNMDDDRSVLGDGYQGKWNIARP